MTTMLTLSAVRVGSEFIRRDVIKIQDRNALADCDQRNKRHLGKLEV
ncbi:MAG: hypothetical protein ACO3RM_11865 [Paracoccaceae bacterium]